MPDAIGIGVGKSGTGTLAFLDCHPNIVFRSTEPNAFPGKFNGALKRLNELTQYKNSMSAIPSWIKPSTANKLNMSEISETYWLEQNLYRTWENWPKQSKWAIPEAAEGQDKLR